VNVLIPFKLVNPKSRLSLFLSREEREKLSQFMLLDVLKAVSDAGVENVRVILQSNAEKIEKILDVDVEVDERDLDDVINDRLSRNTAVIVSDLPLLNGEILRKFFEKKGDIVLAPGRRGGTNMMLIRKEFRVSYHYGSFMKHISIARSMGLKVSIFDSFFAGCDIDTPDDLLEVLLHSPESKTGKYLREIGFRIVLSKNPCLVRVIKA